MAYKALYRTYRPTTFEEVAGQKHIVKTLKNALEKNKIAHAYLFCGPRGTGKTTMAKLFAKALNCEEGIGHQCNKCSNCEAVNDGSHPDVIEIDAASNNGVEEVRGIIEKVKYLPIKGRYKVYIIDEVHMMSSGAFNALLKTLEEPPSHVIFILATTEPHKVLPTIISRCQRYDFTKVEDGEILERLIDILKIEKVQYEDDALRTIVELADGGVRDALSMLDQVLAYSSDEIKLNDVLDLFGITSKDEKIALLEAISNNDIKVVLNKLDSFIKSGIDIKRLTSDLLEILRDLLVYESGGENYQMPTLKEAEAEKLSSFIDKTKCNQMIDVLLKAQSDYKTVANINSLFEIVLLKLATLEKNEPVAEAKPAIEKKVEVIAPKHIEEDKPIAKEILKNDEQIKESLVPTIDEKSVEKISNKNETIAPIIEEKKIVENNKPKIKKDEVPSWLLDDGPKDDTVHTYKQVDDDTMIKIMVVAKKELRQELTKKWAKLDSMTSHPKLGKFATMLKDGRPCVVGDDVIILEYDFDRVVKKINDEQNSDTLSELINVVVEKPMYIYAISRSESVRLRKLFSDLNQIQKLPKKDSIKLNLLNKKEN